MKANHLKIYLILILLCVAFSCKKGKGIPSNKSSLSSITFNDDSIWIKTYRKFNNTILRPKVIEVLSATSDSTGLGIADIGLFNMLLQNYDCKNLKVEDFQTKYPFAKYEFVQNNFDELVALKLFEKEGDAYQITTNGTNVLNLLKKNYQELDDTSVEIFSLGVLRKVSQQAISKDFTGINKSLQNCKKASLRFENSNNKFLQLLTAMNDLIALRNDQSHYRYSFFSNEPYVSMERLSYPEIELLAGIAGNKSFKPNSYLKRPNWGYSENETNAFVKFLIEKELIVEKDSLYQLMDKTKKVEEEASFNCEKYFYQPWLFMTLEEYSKFKTELK